MTLTPTDEKLRSARGARIEFLRKARGLSLTDIADKLGVTKQAVYHWEDGGLPSDQYQRPLAKMLGVEWSVIFTPSPRRTVDLPEPEPKVGRRVQHGALLGDVEAPD